MVYEIPPTPAPGALTVEQQLALTAPPRVTTEAEDRYWSEAEARMRAASAQVDATPAAGFEPPPAQSDYDYSAPSANRMPAVSSVTANTLIGMPAVWICERENLLNNARIQDAPFQIGTVLPGLNYPLDDQDVAALNEHFGIGP